MTVRKFLHAQGFRYRLHDRRLPGSPDVVLPKHKAAIVIHGCFWHRHSACKYATYPSSNVERWSTKFRDNVERDARNEAALRALGWKVIVVWECELRSAADARLDHLVAEIRSEASIPVAPGTTGTLAA